MYESTQCYHPEEHHPRCHENLKSRRTVSHSLLYLAFLRVKVIRYIEQLGKINFLCSLFLTLLHDTLISIEYCGAARISVSYLEGPGL
jgi:hypothetical protein